MQTWDEGSSAIANPIKSFSEFQESIIIRLDWLTCVFGTEMASKRTSSQGSNSNSDSQRIVYREFGNAESAKALERGVPDLPPNQQQVRVQASRKGRKGKTVTVISGFQASPETLASLLKQLKAQCGAGGTLKENEIEIQGDHTQKLAQVLTQLGYKAKVSGG
ncbi:MAG: translation initiation factor [Oculatellaceae cyanobacterium bins.114]|nr:translation initiation factor [Oculatellaceae cyanobacterium bins.114]